jgi:hypothetical protein
VMSKTSALGLWLLLVAAAYSQQNKMPMGLLSSKSSIALRNDVRAEIRLTMEQAIRIQEEMEKMGSVPVGGAAIGLLPIFDQLDSVIRPVLTDDQWKRLDQIWIQYEGPFVLVNSGVAEQLKIEPDAAVKIHELVAKYRVWWNQHIGRVRKTSDLQGIQKEARKTGGKLLQLLTSEQKKQFKEMEGPKFKFQS